MKKCIKITLLVFYTTLLIFPFISSATCTTTQGDTIFGVDEEDHYVWTVTAGNPDFIGAKYNLTIEDIYVGAYMTVDSYIINATVGVYDKTEKIWYTNVDNAFFVAANETLDFISYDSFITSTSLFFIIPIPINLTMIGKYAITHPIYFNYTISGNQIDIEGVGMGHILTFNSDGILTKIVTNLDGGITTIIVLGSGDGEAIPYGYYFMIFTLIGVISLVYLEKKKTK